MPLNIHIANGQEPRHFPTHMGSISPPSSLEPRPDSHIHKKDRLYKEGNMTDKRPEVISIYQEDRYKFQSEKGGGDDRDIYLWPRQWLL